jgi:hypothetical protein
VREIDQALKLLTALWTGTCGSQAKNDNFLVPPDGFIRRNFFIAPLYLVQKTRECLLE